MILREVNNRPSVGDGNPSLLLPSSPTQLRTLLARLWERHFFVSAKGRAKYKIRNAKWKTGQCTMSAAKQPDTAKGTMKAATTQGTGRSIACLGESIQKAMEEGEGFKVSNITERIFSGTRDLSPLEAVKRTREGLPANLFRKMSSWLSIHKRSCSTRSDSVAAP